MFFQKQYVPMENTKVKGESAKYVERKKKKGLRFIRFLQRIALQLNEDQHNVSYKFLMKKEVV